MLVPQLNALNAPGVKRCVSSVRAYFLHTQIAQNLTCKIHKLKKFCERKLTASLDDENACGLLVMADQHSAKHLKAAAIVHIRENAREVRQTEGWKMLLNGNYSELVDQIVEAIIE